MNFRSAIAFVVVPIVLFVSVSVAHADTLTLTSGSNATTTPNVATAITGFQIVGPGSQTTPVKLRATSGTLSLSTVSGVTMTGNGTGTVNLSGTVTNLNTALSTLTYTRGSTGTDTLEVSLVNPTEVFFTDNGHLYQFISGSYTWSGALSAAAAQTAYGVSGYLATITSSAENSFVYQRISGDGWLAASDTDTEKTWKWMAGPELNLPFFQESPGGGGGTAISGRYHGWASGEPNDYGSGEDCGYMYSSQSGAWNDFPCSAQQGYVVEFGSDGNLPTVVATNISITTADVPAVTSLSPVNGGTSVSPTANLVIGFSKAVTKQTGNILIRKSSDNSIVETIDASGDQVTGSGTTSITINPSSTLPEGTQYYVTIPNTAFKDSSNNFFEGITATTTWVFTTGDVTAPSISNISATPTSSGATITWQTNELASTKVLYSVDTSYGTVTSETNTSPRVSSHEKVLSGLLSCTSYRYKVYSEDAFGNDTTSAEQTFLTTGCSGGTTPTQTTSQVVTVNTPTTATLTDTGRTLSVQTPADFTDESSSVVIQIKGLDSTTVLGTIGKPSSALSSAATIVFDVTALINSTTVLDSFDVPVTVSYQYTDTDILGVDESSLTMYHFGNNVWSELDDCSVNTGTNTITCSAPHFSVFAIFGMPASDGGNGYSIPMRVNNLLSAGRKEEAQVMKNQWPWLFPETVHAAPQETISSSLLVRDLQTNMTGEDVRALQKLLNANGFTVAKTGPGSLGNETDRFGALTRAAVSAYQKAHKVAPSIGYFGPKTRASMKAQNFSGVWW